MEIHRPALFAVGAALLLAGAATKITGWEYSPVVYAIGSVLAAFAQITDCYHGSNPTVKRLRKQQVLGASLLVVTALFMFTTHGNEWIACLTVAAVLELYTAFRIPQEEKKGKKE